MTRMIADDGRLARWLVRHAGPVEGDGQDGLSVARQTTLPDLASDYYAGMVNGFYVDTREAECRGHRIVRRYGDRRVRIESIYQGENGRFCSYERDLILDRRSPLRGLVEDMLSFTLPVRPTVLSVAVSALCYAWIGAAFIVGGISVLYGFAYAVALALTLTAGAALTDRYPGQLSVQNQTIRYIGNEAALKAWLRSHEADERLYRQVFDELPGL